MTHVGVSEKVGDRKVGRVGRVVEEGRLDKNTVLRGVREQVVKVRVQVRANASG